MIRISRSARNAARDTEAPAPSQAPSRAKQIAIKVGVTLGAVGIAAASLFPAGQEGQPASPAPGAAPQPQDSVRVLCADEAPGYAHCNALVDSHARSTSEPKGLTPADLQSAYGIPVNQVPNGVLGIVDAYGYNPVPDLKVYTDKFHLAPCTEQNGCIAVYNQDGNSGPLPKPDKGWTGETALDVQAAVGTMDGPADPADPQNQSNKYGVHVVLIEANSTSDQDLTKAEQTAVQKGAKVVSNSWSGAEWAGETQDEKTVYAEKNHPGVTELFASGDRGKDGGEYPATSAGTVAVGGTKLTQVNGAWQSKAWGIHLPLVSLIAGGTGSGCSKFIPKPAFQDFKAANKKCSNRMENDLSAVADPSNGLATYVGSQGGWSSVGGTSLATPVASAWLLKLGLGGVGPEFFYHHSVLDDVTKGANGLCRNLCTAEEGYDGPTGLGTLDGQKAQDYVHSLHGKPLPTNEQTKPPEQKGSGLFGLW